MNPQKVQRDQVRRLEDLPNIGKAMAGDLHRLGIHTPEQLIGQDASEMYERLCSITGKRHDPCVLDVFMSIVHFMAGGEPLSWWQFTARRKQLQRD